MTRSDLYSLSHSRKVTRKLIGHGELMYVSLYLCPVSKDDALYPLNLLLASLGHMDGLTLPGSRREGGDRSLGSCHWNVDGR